MKLEKIKESENQFDERKKAEEQKLQKKLQKISEKIKFLKEQKEIEKEELIEKTYLKNKKINEMRDQIKLVFSLNKLFKFKNKD